jgi:putative transposase
VHLSYQYRLYPHRIQRGLLNRMLDIHRGIYNDALTERREAWKRCGVSISYHDQVNPLRGIRAFDEDAAWCSFSSLQQTLRRLRKSFDGFFRRVKAGEKAGYPRYKGKGWFKSICYVYEDGIRLKEGRLYIHHVGLVRLFQHRPIPQQAKIKMAVLPQVRTFRKRDQLGNWFVILQVETPDPNAAPVGRPAVGIDVGLETFAALSTGERIANPRWFRASQEKLAVLQRRRSRCTRGSRKDRALSRQIGKRHEHTAHQRRDFQHKESAKIVERFGLVAVEDLNVKGLARSHVSKSIADAGWGSFLEKLSYKAEKAGGQFVAVHPNGTSQYCSGCGGRVEKSLSVRTHACPHCGLTLNRDVNAARNVLALGQRVAVKGSAVSAVGASSLL